MTSQYFLDDSSPIDPADQQTNAGSGPIRAAAISAPSKHSTLVGKQLGSYAVKGLLGAGGMGKVYLAKHRWLNSPVAIKVLNPVLNDDPDALVRFQREARIAAQLVHPNIVRATDGGPVGGSFFIVTEFVEGDDLTKIVKRNGPLDVPTACWIIREIALALEYAHGESLVHRDIKPSNIMLPRDAAPKLLDLGLACLTNSTTQLTMTGQFMGTIDYVSPEQATDTRAVDGRSDIYSLGCTFYYLLSGKAPFEGEAYDTVVSKILAHSEEEPASIASLRKDVPQAVKKIIAKTMAKDACDRFQDASELARQLEPFANSRRAKNLFTDDSSALEARRRASEGFGMNYHNEFSQVMLRAVWLTIRTCLSAFGFLELVETPSKSRLGGKPKRQYKFSFRGLIRGVALVVLFVFLYLSGFGIEFGP